jgi:peptidoglycan hydrolase-like protein with peptidoglycan-binding domain
MTPSAQAFNSYSAYDRRRIQSGLAARGYYRGGIDGAFGPGTYSAIVAYANDRGRGRDLGSAAGVYGLFDGLVY